MRKFVCLQGALMIIGNCFLGQNRKIAGTVTDFLHKFFARIGFRRSRMPNRLNFPVFFLLLLIFFSCRKSMPPAAALPPVTEDGLNTFGCIIDGKVWTPYSNCSNGVDKPDMTSKVNQVFDSVALPVQLYVEAENTRSGGSSFWISAAYRAYRYSGINALGNCIDSVDIEYHANSRIYHSTSSLLRDSQYFMITKLDTVNNIISGQFHCRLFSGYDLANSDSLEVTDGRFDFQFAPVTKCSFN